MRELVVPSVDVVIVAGRMLLVDDLRTLQGLQYVLAEFARLSRTGTVPASVRQVADDADALVNALTTDASVSSAGVRSQGARTMTVMQAARTLDLSKHAVRDLCRRKVFRSRVDESGRRHIDASDVANYTPRRDR